MIIKLASLVLIISGILHIVYSEPIARYTRKYYEAFTRGYITLWSVGFMRIQNIVAGIGQILYGLYLIINEVSKAEPVKWIV